MKRCSYDLKNQKNLFREVTANLLSKFIEAGPQARRRDLVDTLTSFLGEVGKAGEASEEFIKLYKKVTSFKQLN